MIRSSSPAVSDISVGSPSPPPSIQPVPAVPSAARSLQPLPLPMAPPLLSSSASPASSASPSRSHQNDLCYPLNMKRLRNANINASNCPGQPTSSSSSSSVASVSPSRRKAVTERVKSFSIADILGKGEQKTGQSTSNGRPRTQTPSECIQNEETGTTRGLAPMAPIVPIVPSFDIPQLSHSGRPPPPPPPPPQAPPIHSLNVPGTLSPHIVTPALVMLDLPALSKPLSGPITNAWDINSSRPLPLTNQPPNSSTLYPFFSPALLHYEQRLAWDYQRQLQEHFQTQAQLLRQMSMDPNIIPSEDGSERSHSSSGDGGYGVDGADGADGDGDGDADCNGKDSHCCSPEVNVVCSDGTCNHQHHSITADDEENDENCDGQKCDKNVRRKSDKNVNPNPNSNSNSNPTSTPKSNANASAIDTPLDALFQLSTKNFDEDQDPATLSIFAVRPNPKKKRKSRTAFTNHQIFELEKRFLYQKYLSPADRDEIAASLGLSNAQVITWFQNRRAKLKRDMEELKKDVESVKQLSAHKSFLENVNDLSILKTRPVSRHHHHHHHHHQQHYQHQHQQSQQHSHQTFTEIYGTTAAVHGQHSHSYGTGATSVQTGGQTIQTTTETVQLPPANKIPITCNKSIQHSASNGDNDDNDDDSTTRSHISIINGSIANHTPINQTTTGTGTETGTGMGTMPATTVTEINQLNQQQHQEHVHQQSQQSNRHYSQNNSSRG